MKPVWILALKILISVGSLYLVSQSLSWKEVAYVLSQAQYSIIAIALFVFWGAQIISALRCVYVARALGGDLDLPISLRAHFVGLWFNQVMPSSLGGDIVKMAILSKQLGLSVAVRSTILDRLFGLVILLLAIVFTMPLYVNLFPSNPELVITLESLAVGGLLTIAIGSWAAQYAVKLFQYKPIILKLIRIFSDVWEFRKSPYWWEQAWTSMIVHCNGIATYALLGLALGIKIDFFTFILIVPIIFLVSLIPISFAGWGLREASAVWLFGIVGIGVDSALAMSISFGLLLIVAGLPGLLISLLYHQSIKLVQPDRDT